MNQIIELERLKSDIEKLNKQQQLEILKILKMLIVTNILLKIIWVNF